MPGAEHEVSGGNPGPGLRCADQFTSLAASPAGTAVSCAALLAVELPLPWPPDVAADVRLTSVAALCERSGHRLQAVVPRSDTPSGSRRLVRFTRAADATGYHRSERLVEHHDVDGAAEELLGEPVRSGRAGVDITDVFVCTHGSRDRCCGGRGTSLYQSLRDAPPGEVHVWRTSHLGGHRFAPTALTMPDGLAWAHLDPGILAGIVERTIPAAVVAGHLRGAASLGDPWQQVADAARCSATGGTGSPVHVSCGRHSPHPRIAGSCR